MGNGHSVHSVGDLASRPGELHGLESCKKGNKEIRLANTWYRLSAVLWIRIRRIRMCLGLQDPDCPDLDPNIRIRPDPSIIKQKKYLKKNFISTVLWLLLPFVFYSVKTNVNVPSKSNQQKKLTKNTYFLLTSWKPLDEKSRILSRIQYVTKLNGSPEPDTYQNVTDPQHCISVYYGNLLITFLKVHSHHFS